MRRVACSVEEDGQKQFTWKIFIFHKNVFSLTANYTLWQRVSKNLWNAYPSVLTARAAAQAAFYSMLHSKLEAKTVVRDADCLSEEVKPLARLGVCERQTCLHVVPAIIWETFVSQQNNEGYTSEFQQSCSVRTGSSRKWPRRRWRVLMPGFELKNTFCDITVVAKSKGLRWYS